MDNLVQTFIEENINLIDREDWEQLFYLTFDPDKGLTNNDIRELLSILTEANILIDEDIRKRTFTGYCEENLQEYMQDEETLPVVIFLRKYCEHTLGYSEDEAAQIIDEHAEAWDIELLDEHGTNPPLTQRLMVSRG